MNRWRKMWQQDCLRERTEFAGRRISGKPDKILVSMEKYIHEELHPVTLENAR